MTVIQLIISDYKKYKKYGSNALVILFLTQGFWATFQYRIAHFIHVNLRIQPFRFLFMGVMYIWQKMIEILTGISIPASASIGDSFYIAHFGGIILNSQTVFGNNCNISQGVTIGVSGLRDKRGVPSIGNNVYIGANAVLAGKIIVGDNALIGACSFVNSDVQENGVVLGVPAVMISDKGSKGYI
jgi:serine O-acetyltransferase